MTGNGETPYKRTSLFSADEFEVVRCEWGQGDASPIHSHHWSQCFSLIEEGLFENTNFIGLQKVTSALESGQVMTTPAGAEHEIKCLSNKGKTLHIYVPRIAEAGKAPLFRQPKAEALQKKLSLSLQSEGMNWQNLTTLLASVFEHSVSTESVFFMNQLFSGVLPETLISEELLAKTRTTMATFEASPVYSLIEMEVVQALGELSGWKKSSIDGVSVPGGSAANFMALHCARQNKFPEFKSRGVYGSAPLKLFVSEESHYSFKKACVVLGLGSDSLVAVQADSSGRMLVSDLEEKIRHALSLGEIPLMVCATAGTTVYGAYDPINQISDLCRQHQVWLHVDAAWGGPALFSKKIRQNMLGIEKADSMTFDAHKLFGAGLTSSLFVTQHPQILLQANDVSGADYLFHNNSEVIDRGRLSWQCGRKPEAVNFWSIWKSYGTDGLGQFVDRLLTVRDETLEWVKTQPRLQLIMAPDYLNICLQVLPPENSKSKTAEWSVHVRDQLKELNLSMVNYSTKPDGTSFLRLILANPQTNFESVRQILNWALEVQ